MENFIFVWILILGVKTEAACDYKVLRSEQGSIFASHERAELMGVIECLSQCKIWVSFSNLLLSEKEGVGDHPYHLIQSGLKLGAGSKEMAYLIEWEGG